MKDLNICYWSGSGNWGDELNKDLCEAISERKVNVIDTSEANSTFRYYCIGSILQSPGSDNYEVWGTGFISSAASLKHIPNKIHAVRGPLTRNILLSHNIECPEIYGDPALLYSKFYKPNVLKEYKYGIVPHYVDYHTEWVEQLKKDKSVNVIHPTATNTNTFVDEVNKCEVILSTSLHGIVCGDSYGIPSYWIELSDKVYGDGFKFRDYFLSVKRADTKPIKVTAKSKLADIVKDPKIKDYKIEIDLDLLYDACPFKR